MSETTRRLVDGGDCFASARGSGPVSLDLAAEIDEGRKRSLAKYGIA